MTRHTQLVEAAKATTTECVLWVGYKNKHGYGQLTHAGVRWLAHRLCYFMHTGEAPPLLRHTCDTPACVNPAHLVPGTQADNVQDMVERGRLAVGDARATKLTSDSVNAIRSRYVKGSRHKPGNSAELAAEFGVSIDYISVVARGAKWASI